MSHLQTGVLFLLVSVGCLLGVVLVGGAVSDGDPSETTVIESEGLENASGTVEVIVRLEGPLPEHAAVDPEQLKTASEQARQPLEVHATATPGVDIQESFWLAPMALVTVDTEQVEPVELTDVPGVTEVHENVPFEPLADIEPQNGSGETTYGLEQLNVEAAWERHGTKGENASVAVIDTGIDVDSHDDLELVENGWAHFNASAEKTDREPFEAHPGSHGTHVSGTVAGDRLDDGAGDRYGVAPEVDLLHAGVMDEDETMTFAQVVAGMEWVIDHERDVDVMTMSLGGGQYVDIIEPVQNAMQTGTVVLAAAGNNGPDTSIAPANVYEAIAIGATDRDREVADFSSGELVDRADAWGADADVYWPREYRVPHVSAPGVDVCSAIADGDYACHYSGTSMATPHVAGVAALTASAQGDIDPLGFEVAAVETADHPEGEPDTRYGAGIVDANATVGYEAGTIHGVVQDNETDTSVSGARVTTGTGYVTGTNETGWFDRPTAPGNQTLTVERVGYETASTSLAVEPDADLRTNVSLEPRAVDGAFRVPLGELREGEARTTTLSVAGVENLTVESGENTTVDPEALSLTVDGESLELGEPTNFSDPYTTDDLTLTVDPDRDAFGFLDLEVTLEGGNETVTVETPTVPVHDDPIVVGGEDAHTDSIREALAVATPGTSVTVHDGTYEKEPEDGVGILVDTSVHLAAADGHEPEISVNGSIEDTGIAVASHAHIENISVVGDGIAAGIAIGDGVESGTIENTTVTGVTTGIEVEGAITELRSNDLEASRTGINLTSTGSVDTIVDTRLAGTGTDSIGLEVDGAAGTIADTTVDNVTTGMAINGTVWSMTNTHVAAADTGMSVERPLYGALENATIHVADGVGVSVTAEGAVDVIGATIDAGTGVQTASGATTVQRSDLRNTTTAINASGDRVTAALNYYGGEPQAEAETLMGSVRYGPFVTGGAQATADPSVITEFGYHITVTNETEAVSFPAGSERTIAESFEPFDGSIWVFEDGNWERVTNPNRTPATLDSFVITAADGEQTTVTVEPSGDVESRTLDAGWNLVGSPAYGPVESVFDSAGVIVALDQFDRPAEEPAAFSAVTVEQWSHHVFGGPGGDGPTVSAHGGYYLYDEVGGDLAPTVPANASVVEYVNALGIDTLGSTAAVAEAD